MEIENTGDLNTQMIPLEPSQQNIDTNIVVAEIEEAVYKQFQEAAFQRYNA